MSAKSHNLDEATKSESSVRPTDDVDCVIEVASRTEYAKLEKKIRSLGFKHFSSTGAPLCRWTYSGSQSISCQPTQKFLGFQTKGDFLLSRDFEDIIT